MSQTPEELAALVLRGEELAELTRQARIDAWTEKFIESAKDPLEALNLRVADLEARLAEQAQVMLMLIRKVEPASQDHEWGEVDETIPRCTCIRWTDWETNVPRRKHNRFCRFPHNA